MKLNRSLWLAIAATFMTASASRALILLNIDVSDPSAVVISATANGASDDSSFNVSSGFNLIGFLTSDFDGVQDFPDGTGTLAFTSGGAIDGSYFGNFTFTDDNVTLFGYGGGTATITTGVAPFSGSSVFDFTDLTAFLPAPGAFGDIQGGDLSPVGPVFGQWQVAAVPEPSTYAAALGAFALAATALRRRRRRSVS